MPLPELTLYTRPGCHLCEQAEEHLRGLEFRYRAVNVDSAPALRARFGDDVPVLAHGERVLAKGVLGKGRLSGLKLLLLREQSSS